MMNIEQMLHDFHVKYGHYRSDWPTIEIPINVKILRLKLIQEEISEMNTAMNEGNLEEFADGIADSVYVLVGACISYGIPFDRVFKEVHRSNMTKTNVKAVDGEKYGTKTPKGPDYIPPDIKGILTSPQRETRLEELGRTSPEKFWP